MSQGVDDWRESRPSLKEKVSHFFMNELASDVKFLVNSQKIPAHRFVLIANSSVFFAMFNGSFAEISSTVAITDCERVDDFIQFLRFLYTEQCDLKWKNVFKILHFSKKYLVSSLKNHCARFLSQQIEFDKVLPILQQAIKFDELELRDRCLQYLCPNISKLVVTEAFIGLEHHVLTLIIKQDQLKISEVDLFKAVEKWCENQVSKHGLPNNPEAKRQVLGDALYLVRFPVMSAVEFATNCAYSGLLTSEECMDIFSFIAHSNSSSPSSNHIRPLNLRFPATPRVSRNNLKSNSISKMESPVYTCIVCGGSFPGGTESCFFCANVKMGSPVYTCTICGRSFPGSIESCGFCDDFK